MTEVTARFGQRGLGGGPLIGIFDEDRRTVAFAPVAELTAVVGGIDRPQEEIEDLAVADDRRVIGDLDRFVVTGAAARDLLVSRVGRRAAGL